MRRPRLFAAALAAILAAMGWGAAGARPIMAPAAAVPGTTITKADVGYHNFGTCCPPGRYSHYRRHHGFSLRLGWGYPSYGYPWAYPAPVYAYPVRPLVAAPTPVVPVITARAPAPWTADWYAYCAGKYRSFDSRTGLYITYSGERRLCQ